MHIPYDKRQFSPSVNLFWLNVAFSIFYWVMESVRDVIVFEKGNIFERIFYPDSMSFWMRMLAIFIFILFSAYSHSLREKIERRKIRVSKGIDEYGVIWVGIGFAVLYWTLEAFRDAFVFQKNDFLHQFFMPDPIRFWVRILVVFILMLFSLYSQTLINKRRKTEEALKNAHDELENKIRERTIELSKSKEMQMEAIGVLAGGVAHDYNNMLTVIQGLAELMMMGIDEKNPMFQDLKDIRSATKQAVDLTQQLLLFSQRKAMHRVSFNLNKLVNVQLKKFQSLVGAKIEMRADLGPELWTIKADPGTIEQMITNLVINARDAMPGGGKIILRTSNVYIDELYCNGDDPEARPGPFVRLTVSDNGPGMTKETLRHIFEPFFTTKGLGKGTGLGLSVIYGIVKQHEGWITVYSEFGHGSTFRVYLPAMEPGCTVETEACQSPETMQGKGERILVVEDELNVAEFNKKVLTQYGYSVFLSRNLQEARQMFRSEKGNFQLVFSDVVLPDGNGIDLLDEFLRFNPDLHVMLSSGYMDHKLQWPAIERKRYRFLQKPYSLADLLKAIRDETGVRRNA